MIKSGTLPAKYIRLVLLGLLVSLLAGTLNACASESFNSENFGNPTATLSEFWPVSNRTSTPLLPPTRTPIVWNTFAPPSASSITEVPSNAPRLELPEDVKIWLLMLSDQEAPLKGRTYAIHLLFLNERLSKASLIAIPDNLFVYLPGHNMQRINTAYALGGIALVKETLAYNFGIRPDRFVVGHPMEFRWLVDDLDGLDVSVLFPIPDACGGLPAGIHAMNGEKALCYFSYLSGQDEIDRTRRQQQIIQLLFTKLVQNGRLARLPVLYASYQSGLDTDISFLHLLERVPLALRLGDPDRFSYFLVGRDQTSSWQLSDESQTLLLLPDQQAISQLFAQVLENISVPAPLGEIVLTYEAQATLAVAMTQTMQPLPTLQLVYTSAPSSTLPLTRTAASTGTPSGTRTPTPTRTRVPTAIIPTLTPFPTQPYPIGTPGETPTPYP